MTIRQHRDLFFSHVCLISTSAGVRNYYRRLGYTLCYLDYGSDMIRHFLLNHGIWNIALKGSFFFFRSMLHVQVVHVEYLVKKGWCLILFPNFPLGGLRLIGYWVGSLKVIASTYSRVPRRENDVETCSNCNLSHYRMKASFKRVAIVLWIDLRMCFEKI